MQKITPDFDRCISSRTQKVLYFFKANLRLYSIIDQSTVSGLTSRVRVAVKNNRVSRIQLL